MTKPLPLLGYGSAHECRMPLRGRIWQAFINLATLKECAAGLESDEASASVHIFPCMVWVSAWAWGLLWE